MDEQTNSIADIIRASRTSGLFPMLVVGAVILLLSVFAQFYLLRNIFLPEPSHSDIRSWMLVHIVAALAISLATILMSVCVLDKKPLPLNRNILSHPALGIGVLTLMLGLFIPIVGGIGVAVTFLIGGYIANRRVEEEIYWQETDSIELPFVTPSGRKVSKYDSRGFAEQLMYSSDNDDLYRKVLAASNVKASLSISLLKKAVEHPDDRIRLTAYQTLDRKVTGLNREIQRLEDQSRTQKGQNKCNTWLQIASNYWELLTLEKGEEVAQKQLLRKAKAAAEKAIEIQPENRNAHFTLARTSLMARDTDTATKSFKRALELGMAAEKVKPYLAEAAFEKKDFKQVVEHLDDIDDAFKLYPPLSHVAAYWR